MRDNLNQNMQFITFACLAASIPRNRGQVEQQVLVVLVVGDAAVAEVGSATKHEGSSCEVCGCADAWVAPGPVYRHNDFLSAMKNAAICL